MEDKKFLAIQGMIEQLDKLHPYLTGGNPALMEQILGLIWNAGYMAGLEEHLSK